MEVKKNYFIFGYRIKMELSELLSNKLVFIIDRYAQYKKKIISPFCF